MVVEASLACTLADAVPPDRGRGARGRPGADSEHLSRRRPSTHSWCASRAGARTASVRLRRKHLCRGGPTTDRRELGWRRPLRPRRSSVGPRSAHARTVRRRRPPCHVTAVIIDAGNRHQHGTIKVALRIRPRRYRDRPRQPDSTPDWDLQASSVGAVRAPSSYPSPTLSTTGTLFLLGRPLRGGVGRRSSTTTATPRSSSGSGRTSEPVARSPPPHGGVARSST